MQPSFSHLLIFLGLLTLLVLLMGSFIVLILFLHKKKQIKNTKLIEYLKTNYELELMRAQLEIQEQTFQEISREIHDNINLSLTLAKLHLNTYQSDSHIDLQKPIDLLGKSILDLSDLSRSMNSEIVSDCGLAIALSMEIERIKKLNKLEFKLTVEGSPIFLSSKKELYLFRIIQEALNNILKHSKATSVDITLHYSREHLEIQIKDNGKGIAPISNEVKTKSYPSIGLKNMQKRISLLNGQMSISTKSGNGTLLSFTVPIKSENGK